MVRLLKFTQCAIAALSGVAMGELADAAPIATDPARGRVVFQQKCAICHVATRVGNPGVGPNLFGVIGRKSGSLPSYNYSKAMKANGIIWTEAKLNSYLAAPQQSVPGTKMPFGGLKESVKAADLIAYLATLK